MKSAWYVYVRGENEAEFEFVGTFLGCTKDDALQSALCEIGFQNTWQEYEKQYECRLVARQTEMQ